MYAQRLSTEPTAPPIPMVRDRLAFRGETMIHRRSDANAFEFVRLSALRAAQLMRGCTPRVAVAHKAVVTAQREVAEGKVISGPRSK